VLTVRRRPLHPVVRKRYQRVHVVKDVVGGTDSSAPHRQHRSITDCAVLTVTGFVNRKWQYSTRYRIDTPEPITKTLSQVITSAIPTAVANLVHIRRVRGASGRMGEI